jgi:hypothetical protein
MSITKTAKNYKRVLLFVATLFACTPNFAQGTPPSSQLDKMPVDLETDYALSSLPLHLRSGATVYLLDPKKGFYVSHRGTNGYICFVSRTSWEWADFRDDVYTPISFDPEGARSIFPIYLAAAAMRATGKYSPEQVRDSIKNAIIAGKYKAPAKPGLSYMLSPIVRIYPGLTTKTRNIVTMNMPHYMIYAPYMLDVNKRYKPGTDGMIVTDPENDFLGDGKGPYNFIILPATDKEKQIILDDNKDLLKRLVAYKACFKQ